MAKRISGSLSAKVFLWIAGLLFLCSLLIYGIVMAFLPRSYTMVASSRVSEEIDAMTAGLSQSKYEDADGIIDRFCQENRASVVLSDGVSRRRFGSDGADITGSRESMSVNTEVSFSDTARVFFITVIVPVSAGRELTAAFLKLLPSLLVLIVFISALGAFLCSRVLVRPILEISRISKRMANLDMTWVCSINRTDELGVLAESLNTMSRRLGVAMRELEDANRQLRRDMEHINALSMQRRDFFAAASHELKTPVTILKGQIESMILEIGSYRDTKRALPETLREVEHMERLVKEILAVSRVEIEGLAGENGEVSLSALLEKAAEALLPLAQERGIAVTRRIEPGVIISGNASLMEKALHNIISNALCHSPEGAEVFIDMSRTGLTVRNTGVTIPEGDLAGLFTPFYRVEKSRNKATGGSGLGLYLAGTILDAHGMSCQIRNDGDSVRFDAGF